MGLTDIIIIAIGLVCVVISFFLSEKIGGSKKAEERAFEEFREKFQNKLLEEENLELLFKSVERSFAEKTDAIVSDSIEEVRDKISTLSNDQIMQFNDYSGEVLEKIEQNHTEVVFLYDMLKEKESTLKDFSAKLDAMKASLNETIDKAKQAEKETKDNIGEIVAVDEKEVVVPKKITKKTTPKKSEKSEKAPTVRKITKADTSSVSFAGDSANKNDKILELYNRGKSVVEISKVLGLGQGEVKLVIDLFKNAK